MYAHFKNLMKGERKMRKKVVKKRISAKALSLVLSLAVVLSTISAATIMMSDAAEGAFATKSAKWTANYLEDGLAEITLTAHDPSNTGSTTTLSPVDVTIIQDRSDSMAINNDYGKVSEAVQKAYDQNNNITAAELWTAGMKVNHGQIASGAMSLDNNSGQWKAVCQNKSHKYIMKVKNFASGTVRTKLLEFMNANAADRNATDLSTVKAIGIDSKATAQKWLTDTANSAGIKIDNSSITVQATWGNYDINFDSSTNAYSFSSDSGFVIIDMDAFFEYAGLNSYAQGNLHNFMYIHVGANNTTGKYEILSSIKPIYYVDKNGVKQTVVTDGKTLQACDIANYAKGCIDYLKGAQDGLSSVTDKILSAGGRINYMQFGDETSVYYGNGGSGKYYTSAEKAELMNHILTYRTVNSDVNSLSESDLTPWRVRNGGGTFYVKGVENAASNVNSTLSNAKSTHIVLFVSDGTPSELETSMTEDNFNSAVNTQIKNLMDTIKGKGAQKIYFDTVGISLSENQSKHLRNMANYADTLDGVTSSYFGSYVDISDSEQFTQKIEQLITSIASTSATYTDVLSEYFEFTTTPSYELTVSDNEDYTGGTTVTESSDVSISGNTLTWTVPEPKKYSKLTFKVKLKDQYMQSGTNGAVPTNASAEFKSGDKTFSDTSADPDYKIDKPTLSYEIVSGDAFATKSAKWTANYLEDGLAEITLTAHDPSNTGSTTTLSPVDVTIIQDRSDSMAINNDYGKVSEAVQKAYDQNNNITAAELWTAGMKVNHGQIASGAMSLDNNSGQWKAVCQNKSHKYIMKVKNFASGTVRTKLLEFMNANAADRNATDLSTVKAIGIDSKATAQKWLTDTANSAGIKIDNSSITVQATWGNYDINFDSSTNAYSFSSDSGFVIIDMDAFFEYAGLNSYAQGNLHNFMYIHVGANNTTGKYEILSSIKPIYYVDKNGVKQTVVTDGKTLQACDIANYAKGCIDYLKGAQDGLSSVTDKILSAGGRINYMQFGDETSVYYGNGGSGKYYTSAEKAELMNHILTYRTVNSDVNSLSESDLTPWRVRNGGGTFYVKGVENAASNVNSTLSNAKSTHIVLFVSDGTPSELETSMTEDNFNSAVNTQIKNLMDTIKGKGAQKIYFDTVGISLSENQSKHLRNMANYADTLDGVTSSYFGSYVDISDSEQFTQKIEQLITSIASTSATYTDVLSEYFEFTTTPSYELTVSDNEDYTGGTTVTESSDVSISGNTLTWTVPEPKKYSKLTFKVKLKDQYMQSGTNGAVPTNASAEFKSGDKTFSDTSADPDYKIDKPTLSYENAAVTVNKTLAWDDATGVAKVTVTFNVTGGSGNVTYTDTINSDKFAYYADASRKPEGGTFANNGNDITFTVGSVTGGSETKTLTYYIKAKELHDTATLDDNKNSAVLKFGSIEKTEQNGDIPNTTLNIKYTPLKAGAKVTDIDNPNLPSNYTVEDKTNGISYALGVTANSTAVISATKDLPAGSYSFKEYKNGSEMKSNGIDQTVTSTNTAFTAVDSSSVSGDKSTLSTNVLVNGESTYTIEYVNSYTVLKAKLKIKKVDESGTELSGSSFEIRNSSGAVVATVSGNGNVTGAEFEIGKQYTIVETKAPTGYQLKGEEMVFTASVTPSGALSYDRASNTMTYTVADMLKNDILPATGGVGLYVTVGAGVLIMLVAAAYFFISRKHKKDRDDGGEQ